MHYFFVTIKYHFKGNAVTFSAVFKSENYLTKTKIIEKAMLKKYHDHKYLGPYAMYDLTRDENTEIVSYSNLTKQQYEMYKNTT